MRVPRILVLAAIFAFASYGFSQQEKEQTKAEKPSVSEVKKSGKAMKGKMTKETTMERCDSDSTGVKGDRGCCKK